MQLQEEPRSRRRSNDALQDVARNTGEKEHAGRAFFGLAPGEKHPSEFHPRPLPDELKLTVWLVLSAVVVALVVILVGSAIHRPTRLIVPSFGGQCPSFAVHNTELGICERTALTWWDQIPMAVWFFYAGLAAALVVITPFLAYRVKHRTGQI